MKWFLFFPVFLVAQYGFFPKTNGKKVTSMQIYGEMHSGTNYLEMLLKKNFPQISVYSGLDPQERIFGHKHFPAWFTGPLSYHSTLGIAEKYWTLQGSGETLFIVIVRDPYDWIRALYKLPFHRRKGKRFSYFIRRQARFKLSEDRINAIDLNPKTGGFFKNPMKMRSAKLDNILHLADRVDHCIYIKYENLRDNPNEVLSEIAARFQLEKTPKFVPIKTYKSTEIVYTGSRYFPIAEKDLNYINNQLDWDIEEKFGYDKKSRIQ